MSRSGYVALSIATALVIATQITCTLLTIHQVRVQAAWEVVEDYKACKNVWNPWERQPD